MRHRESGDSSHHLFVSFLLLIRIKVFIHIGIFILHFLLSSLFFFNDDDFDDDDFLFINSY